MLSWVRLIGHKWMFRTKIDITAYIPFKYKVTHIARKVLFQRDWSILCWGFFNQILTSPWEAPESALWMTPLSVTENLTSVHPLKILLLENSMRLPTPVDLQAFIFSQLLSISMKPLITVLIVVIFAGFFAVNILTKWLLQYKVSWLQTLHYHWPDIIIWSTSIELRHAKAYHNETMVNCDEWFRYSHP